MHHSGPDSLWRCVKTCLPLPKAKVGIGAIWMVVVWEGHSQRPFGGGGGGLLLSLLGVPMVGKDQCWGKIKMATSPLPSRGPHGGEGST